MLETFLDVWLWTDAPPAPLPQYATSRKASAYVMTFGKFRGQPIEDVPDDYIGWCLANLDWAVPTHAKFNKRLFDIFRKRLHPFEGIKAKPAPAKLFETSKAQTAYQRGSSRPLILPEPQGPYIWPDPPGKRVDGKLWFEGPLKRKAETVDEHSLKRPLKSYGDELKPRDYRTGDRWLPWHFLESGEPRP